MNCLVSLIEYRDRPLFPLNFFSFNIHTCLVFQKRIVFQIYLYMRNALCSESLTYSASVHLTQITPLKTKQCCQQCLDQNLFHFVFVRCCDDDSNYSRCYVVFVPSLIIINTVNAFQISYCSVYCCCCKSGLD